MTHILQTLKEDPIRILPIVIIIACIIGLAVMVNAVCKRWQAWRIKNQKKKPPVRYPIHFDKRV